MRTKDPSEVQLNGILSLFNQRDFHQVLAKARPLLKQNKKSFILNRIVGAAEAELGHFDNALICFKRMLQIDPKSAETLFFIGNVMVAKQRIDSAIKSYRLALDQKPKISQQQHVVVVLLIIASAFLLQNHEVIPLIKLYQFFYLLHLLELF